MAAGYSPGFSQKCSSFPYQKMCLTKYSYVITSYTEAHSYTPTAHELLAEIHVQVIQDVECGFIHGQ